MSGLPSWLPAGAELARCSSLPTAADCLRRWVAHNRRTLVRRAGYVLSEVYPSIGAHVGSATHAGVALGWQGVLTGGQMTAVGDCDEAAIATLRQRKEEDGVLWDDTTPSENDAEIAVRKLIRSYREHAPRDRRPMLIEAELAGKAGDRLYLWGHTDLYLGPGADDPGWHLDDLKTGVRPPAPIEQLGGYHWLARAKHPAPGRTTMTWMRRVRRSAEQPPPMVRAFDGWMAERAAKRTLREIGQTLEEFKQGNGDPIVFRANCSSVLCSRKFCGAYKTSWCPESQIKAED